MEAIFLDIKGGYSGDKGVGWSGSSPGPKIVTYFECPFSTFLCMFFFLQGKGRGLENSRGNGKWLKYSYG